MKIIPENGTNSDRGDATRDNETDGHDHGLDPTQSNEGMDQTGRDGPVQVNQVQTENVEECEPTNTTRPAEPNATDDQTKERKTKEKAGKMINSTNTTI